jgi:hypothetical protein
MSAERERILALFEKHRAAPGTPYDESHFLDFLMSKPKGKGAVYNSFRGLRRFNAFLDEVQYEFAICFSIKDRSAHYTLDKFVTRVQELQGSSRSSLASLRNQMQGRPNLNVVVFSNLILLGPAIGARKYPWALGCVVAVIALVNLAFFLFHRRERTYQARLLARITSQERVS